MSLSRLFRTGNLWLKHLPWKSRPVAVCMQPCRNYPRGARSRKTTLQELSVDGDFTSFNHEMSVTDQLEALEDMVSTEQGQPLLKDSRVDFKMREKIKAKIIERKYFRQPQEMNLLTWDAKEQIRYLNHEFPEEWTIDRLAESFPISREGVIKLLKSTFCPSSFEEMVNHDKRVRKNWMKLTDGKGGPAALWYETLLKEGKVCLLENAAGVPALPKPTTQAYLPPGKTGFVKPSANKPGLFESIVKDYCDQKKAASGVQSSGERSNHSVDLIKENDDNNKKALGSIITSAPGQQLALLESGFKKSLAVGASSGKRISLRYDDPNLTTHSTVTSDSSSPDAHLDMFMDHVSGESPMGVDSFGKLAELSTQHVEVETGKYSSNIVNSEDSGLKGTTKISSRQIPSVNGEVYSTETPKYKEPEIDEGEYLQQHIRQFKQDKIQKEMASRVYYESSASLPNHTEAYIYEPDTSYQYPYGKHDETVKDIEIPQEHKLANENSNKVFKKGDSFYDVDGEFLFKVPC